LAETKSLTISLAVWIQHTSVTDGQTDTGRQLVTALTQITIASRGENVQHYG